MIEFFDVDINYINYLKQYESKIPNIEYNNSNKFICGVVQKINDLNYYAPISSKTSPQRTSLLIYDNQRVISSIKFAFMFPVPDDALAIKNISQIRLVDSSYADLLQMEYSFCNSHENEIIRKAQSVYRYGTNPNHHLFNCCCNFTLLEEKYNLYI